MLKRFDTILLILVLSLLTTSILFSSPAQAQVSTQGAYPNCPSVPSTFNVRLQQFWAEGGYSGITNLTMDTEEYVWGVVLGELGPTVTEGPFTGAWDVQVLRATAVAARTYAGYHCKKRTFGSPPLQGLNDTSSDQVYRPDYVNVTQATKNKYSKKSRSTKGTYLTWDGLLVEEPFNGPLMDAQHRTDVGEQSCSWRSAVDPCFTATGYEMLASVNNYPTVRDTRDVGFAQLSSQSWRKLNDKKASYAICFISFTRAHGCKMTNMHLIMLHFIMERINQAVQVL